MNRVIIGQNQKGYHFGKDASEDILSLADQLHRLHSTNPEKLPAKGDYFLENNVPDLLRVGKNQLPDALAAYNKSKMAGEEANKALLLVPELEGQNKEINNLFSLAREEAIVTTDHQGI